MSFNRLMFDAYRTHHLTSVEDITYQRANLNVDNCLNLDTGIFQTPQDGIYSFDYSGFSRTNCKVRLYVDGVIEASTFTQVNTWTSCSLCVTLRLSTGSKVKLYLEEGTLYDAEHERFNHFRCVRMG